MRGQPENDWQQIVSPESRTKKSKDAGHQTQVTVNYLNALIMNMYDIHALEFYDCSINLKTIFGAQTTQELEQK